MIKWLKKKHIIHYYWKWRELEGYPYRFATEVFSSQGRKDELWIIEMRKCRKCPKRQVRLRNCLK